MSPPARKNASRLPCFAASYCILTARCTAPIMERRTGIEPVSSAWKAEVLPLNYRRFAAVACTTCFATLVEGEGFEPSKAEPSDLQSDPFDRSGTPPAKRAIMTLPTHRCQSFSDIVVSFCARANAGSGDYGLFDWPPMMRSSAQTNAAHCAADPILTRKNGAKRGGVLKCRTRIL
jgi:hypothetical protein